MTPTVRSPRERVDDLDRLLGSFFHSELPAPWPAVPLAPARQTGGWRLAAMRSRFALAASLAVLAGGTLLLGGSFRAVKAPIRGLETGTAKHESPGKIRTELFLQQLPDGPTTIKINVEELPAR